MEKFIRDVLRWLALKDLARDMVGNITRAALCRVILSSPFNRHIKDGKLGRPFYLPWQFGVAVEG